jgi:hypothetical protein
MGDWYASLGQEEEAVRWLEHAAELGFINWPVLNEVDAFLDPIRGGSLFQGFMAKVQARWEAFEP